MPPRWEARPLHYQGPMARTTPVLLAFLIACSPDQPQQTGAPSAAPKATDSMSGTLSSKVAGDTTTAATATATATTTTTQAQSTSDATAKGPRRAPPDSAVLLGEASQPEHRTKADSISLVVG